MEVPPRESKEDPAFLNPALCENNIDRYWARSSVLGAVKNALPLFKGVFLDIGCGVMPYKSLITEPPSAVTRYIGMDIETDIYKAKVDLRWDGLHMPLEDASVDSAMATEVLEHCPDPLAVLREARRVLKPGGVFFFTVPYLWPLHDAPYDFYRYTSFALEKLLKDAGFADIGVKPLGGWNASLAQMIGLWLGRAPLSPENRATMMKQLFPFYKTLTGNDLLPDSHASNTMVTGWTGLAFVSEAGAIAGRRRLDIPKIEGLAVAKYHESAYSETFIEDHIADLSDSTTVLWGAPPFTVNVRGESPCLSAAEIHSLRSTPPAEISELVASRIARRLVEKRARVLLAEYGPIGVSVMRAAELAGIPLVVHFHGYDASVNSWFANNGEFYRRLFQSARRIVVVSKAMRKRLIDEGAPADKVVLNSCGVDVEGFTPVAAGDNPPLFLAVGRFVEKKRPDLTIAAFAKIAAAVPGASLYMVGDGDLFHKCRQMVAQRGLQDRVHLVGSQSRSAVRAYLSRARAFVQHSMTAQSGDSEGMPVGILEAGAAGLPVVSTVHAGIPDAVRDRQDGFVVAEGDVDAMAAGMLLLARDPALATSMGRSFRSRIESEYTRRARMSALSDIITSVL